jgi:simple sugar transport system ATP-binding protein
MNEASGTELASQDPSSSPRDSAQTILELHGITRTYGHVRALRGVDLDLQKGEILGLVGDNGAGKSTLMKIIAGTERADEGTITIDGKRVDIRVAADARRLGIEMIYQHLALFDNLDVASNIFIGREPTRGARGLLGFVERRRTHREATELLSRLKIQIQSTRLLVKNLSGGQRQMVAIARAVAFADRTRIVIMDEPSAALGTTESKTVLEAIGSLRTHGHSIIVISHRLPELLDLCDRITILKQGEKVATLHADQTSVEQCVNLIVAGRAAVDQPSTT